MRRWNAYQSVVKLINTEIQQIIKNKDKNIFDNIAKYCFDAYNLNIPHAHTRLPFHVQTIPTALVSCIL